MARQMREHFKGCVTWRDEIRELWKWERCLANEETVPELGTRGERVFSLVGLSMNTV